MASKILLKMDGLARGYSYSPMADSYKAGWFRADVIAGLTLWGILVPEGIAYAALSACQMTAISAVLPLKAYGRRYIDDPRRCHILLTSLAKFAPEDLFEDIFVIVPARERAHAEALRHDWRSLPLVVIDE